MSYLKGETLSKSRKKNNNAKFLFSIISGIQKMQKKKKKMIIRLIFQFLAKVLSIPKK